MPLSQRLYTCVAWGFELTHPILYSLHGEQSTTNRFERAPLNISLLRNAKAAPVRLQAQPPLTLPKLRRAEESITRRICLRSHEGQKASPFSALAIGNMRSVGVLLFLSIRG